MSLHVNLHNDLTDKQKQILRSKSEHLIIKGPAGTAKTYSAMARGLISLRKNAVDRIVVIRSPVEIRQIGHLPGDADEKVEAYAAPYIDLLKDLSPKLGYRALVQKKMLEFLPTTFLRGCTLQGCYVIADEFQNFSAHEFETIVTRIGAGSQLVLVGDDDGQSDLGYREIDEYRTILGTVENMSEFETFSFDTSDIVRSGLVKSYHIAKQRAESARALPRQCA